MSIILRKSRSKDLIWGFGNKNYIDINGKKTILQNIKLGDVIYNCKINGIIHISKDSITEYIYTCKNGKKIYVSGNELVKENNKWLRVYQSDRAILSNDSKQDYYINFVTDDNNIMFNDSFFKDFMESSDKITNQVIDNIVDKYLTNVTY